MKRGNWIKYGFGFLILGTAIIAIVGLATMYLWNWLVPVLFNGASITFWQAIGLLALLKIVGGILGFGRLGWRKHGYGMGHGYWRKKWEAKMENMSPEEKEKFKSYYYERCGYRREVKEEGAEQ
jgi:hypothetical protein